MPSLITHHVFSEEVYKKLNKNEQKNIEETKIIFNTFAQSHDYLFYCRFNIAKGKYLDDLGHHAHRHKTQNYLINILKNMKQLSLENNSEYLSYLYGSITHYVLDSTCHPFIFYKGGAWNKDDKKTFKYRGEHNHIEKDLDAIYYKNYYKQDYKYCNISKDIIKNPKFSDELYKLINKTYKDTYDANNIAFYYQKGIKYCKTLSSIAINDRFGIKRSIYILLDKITNKCFGMISCFSTHLNPDDRWLNKNHKEWNNPCNIKLKYNYSFEDLYKMSLEKSIKLIDICNKYLNNEITLLEVKKHIPNISYSNGLPEKDFVPMRHFEY